MRAVDTQGGYITSKRKQQSTPLTEDRGSIESSKQIMIKQRYMTQTILWRKPA
jgi:hypothetical protein